MRKDKGFDREYAREYYAKHREKIIKRQRELRRNRQQENEKRIKAKLASCDCAYTLDPNDPRWKNAEVHIVHHRPKKDIQTQKEMTMGQFWLWVKEGEMMKLTAEAKRSQAELERERYQRDRESILQKRKELHQQNPETIREIKRRYYAKHREERLAYQKRYNQENREKQLENSRQYYAAHREERLAYQREYRRRVRNVGARNSE